MAEDIIEQRNHISGNNQFSEVTGKQKNEIYWEWLCSIPGVYRAQQEVLLKCFETPEGVWMASDEEVEHIMSRGRKWIRNIRDFRKQYTPEQLWQEHREKGIQFVSCENKQYPYRLNTIQDRPYGLFLKGQLPDGRQKAVGIVQ